MQAKRSTLIGIAAVALAVAGCDSSRDTRARHTTTTAAVGSAPEAILAAAAKLKSASAYTESFSSDLSVNGQSEQQSGSFNYRTRQSVQKITSAGGNTPADQNGRQIQAVATGTLLYIEFPPAMRRGYSTPWLSFTAAQYNRALGQHGGLEAVKSPFLYGAVGLRDQFAQYLISGAPTFLTAGRVTDHGHTFYAYRGYAGPITLTLTTRTHKTIHEAYARLGLTVWLDAAGRVHFVTARSVAKDASTITERFRVVRYSAPRVLAPPRAQVTSYRLLKHS